MVFCYGSPNRLQQRGGKILWIVNNINLKSWHLLEIKSSKKKKKGMVEFMG